MTKDRGPRTFVLICTIAIAAVIAYPLMFGRDGFLKTFPKMLEEAGLLYDSQGRKRSVYSLRHTYATFRLENGANVYWLRQNMGTSVQMIERHYGQTKVLVGIEHETARRKKQKRRPDFAEPTPAMIAAPDPVITVNDDD